MKHRISIIALTDHNTASNIERAVSYAAKYAGQLLFIPGAEITTAHGHLLAYFAPDKAVRVQDLVSRLSIIGTPGR